MTNEMIQARCKANAMTTIQAYRACGNTTPQGLAMIDQIEMWLKSEKCEFAVDSMLKINVRADKLDQSVFMALVKAYQDGNK